MSFPRRSAFYGLTLLCNGFAVALLGISFLAGPGNENIDSSSGLSTMQRHFAYAIIVSLVFSVLSFVVAYVFKGTFDFSRKMLLRLSVIEFVFLFGAFTLIYLIVLGFSG